MRKLQVLSSIIIASVLIVSTLGFSVSRHYCLGMLAEESFYHLGSETCGMEYEDDGCDTQGSHYSNHCCDDEILSIPGLQVQERQDSPENGKNLVLEITSVPVAYEALREEWMHEIQFTSGSPPFQPVHPNGTGLLIRYQRFLI